LLQLKLSGKVPLVTMEITMFGTRVLLLTAVLILAGPCSANSMQDTRQVSREQAAALAQQQYPGRIVKVQTVREFYRIRLVQPDGRVITVLVDGKTGRVKKDGN
jgi:hypothetical protein